MKCKIEIEQKELDKIISKLKNEKKYAEDEDLFILLDQILDLFLYAKDNINPTNAVNENNDIPFTNDIDIIIPSHYLQTFEDILEASDIDNMSIIYESLGRAIYKQYHKIKDN